MTITTSAGTQTYCRNVTDHSAHTVVTAVTDNVPEYFRCPGRYTPSLHSAPHVAPKVPADPFALIEGAYSDED